MFSSTIIRNFDAAAPRYDRSASAQASIAARLVGWAAESGVMPASVLDIGCGTGFVAEALHRRWPQAAISALDASPSMLEEARRKLPKLAILTGDALDMEPRQAYDAIFSSMALHWLPDARAALGRWQSWLKPEGRLFAALPVEGSFHQWRDLCRRHDAGDGLWVLPSADFADDMAARMTQEDRTIAYPSAKDFLRYMKLTGAATPRSGHRPVGAAKMRRILNDAVRPFSATYRLAFLELLARCPSSDP
jgi:malonyl-CoA O-methyltransferase